MEEKIDLTWEERLQRTEEISKYVQRYRTILSIQKPGTTVGTIAGTGYFLGKDQNIFLITCAHVVEDEKGVLTKEIPFLCLYENNASFVPIESTFIATKTDIAITNVSKNWEKYRTNKADYIALDKMKGSDLVDPSEYFFVSGYPSDNENKRIDLRTLQVCAENVLTNCKCLPELENISLNRDEHFALDYSENLRTHDAQTVVDPRGMSGSLVWDTGLLRCKKEKREWTPEEMRVVGVLFNWDGENTLICSKITTIDIEKVCSCLSSFR